MAFLLLVVALALLSAGPRAQWKTKWSYDGVADGPDHWGDLDPDYAACKTGDRKSVV